MNENLTLNELNIGLKFGADVNVRVSRNYDAPIRMNPDEPVSDVAFNVHASYQKKERNANVNLRYDSNGSRLDEVTDFSYPFTEDFYSALDAFMPTFSLPLNPLMTNNNA